MKKQISLYLILCILLVSSHHVAGQTGIALPSNKALSFNGKFINPSKKELNSAVSENGMYKADYFIGSVSDENRIITDFELQKTGKILYSKKELGGADLEISNSGYVAVYDMDEHFMQKVSLHFINREGETFRTEAYRYASLFGFSPSGNSFVAGLDSKTQVLDLAGGGFVDLPPSSKFAFSPDDKYFVTAREGQLLLYADYTLLAEISTGLFYPRALAIDPENNLLAVIGKDKLMAYDLISQELKFMAEAPQNCSFRDILINNGHIFAGLHNKSHGVSKGILNCYNSEGELLKEELMAEKKYNTFQPVEKPVRSSADYESIPWPFEPFDEVHKVWNHYEQHMGNGSGDWSYLHQGLDLEVPINEPTYAVQEGWVKLVLTLGGDAYWRVAVSPEQSSGYSDGWLYAHLVESSIQVDVGDYIELHDYLGDIIFWSSDWGHIHFVNIHDQGDIWYYDDDEWGINFNPLLALTPLTDDQGPVIEDFSSSSKFGYCENETSNYLDPDNLSGDIDIIAKISDYHGTSNWEQPAYRTYYWLKKLPEGSLVFPKTLGQILNHPYTMYNSGYYENYAPLLYKKDWLHPSPPWMNNDRDYYQILTNNNGDSVAEPWETELAFNTMEFYDGAYQVFIEAWDEYGNVAIDSQEVIFANGIIDAINDKKQAASIVLYPNPARDKVMIEGIENSALTIAIHNSQMKIVKETKPEGNKDSSGIHQIGLEDLSPGIYYVTISSRHQNFLKKLIIN